MKIRSIYDTIKLLKKQGQSGYFSPVQVMEALHTAQIDKFNKCKEKYGKDLDNTSLLEPFKRRSERTLISGASLLPTDYEKLTEASNLIVQGLTVSEVPMRIVPEGRWVSAISSKSREPDILNPVCTVMDGKLICRPVDCEPVMYYLSTPVKPVYGLTTANDRDYIFDSNTSVDIQWHESAVPDLILRTLSYLGVSLGDQALQIYEKIRKQNDAVFEN